jgi:hypothetical protein
MEKLKISLNVPPRELALGAVAVRGGHDLFHSGDTLLNILRGDLAGQGGINAVLECL